MARIKRAVNGHKKRRKIFKLAKGYWGARSKQYRVAREAVMKAQAYAYVGRKLRKRDFRRLWIARINAACRAQGITYSVFMHALKKGGVDVNRKMLSELAIHDAAAFTAYVDLAKKQISA